MVEAKLQIVLQEIVKRLNNENRQIKLLDQRIQAIEKKFETIENTNVAMFKKYDEKISNIDSAINDVRELIKELEKKTEGFNRQINKFATKKDIKELEQMFELLSPIAKGSLAEDV